MPGVPDHCQRECRTSFSFKPGTVLRNILQKLYQCGKDTLMEIMFQFCLTHRGLTEVEQFLADGMCQRPGPDEVDLFDFIMRSSSIALLPLNGSVRIPD